MVDVFISYKRRFRPRVAVLAEKLREYGLDVWFDAGLEPGISFSEEIADRLRSAKAVIVCWSPDCFGRGGDKQGWVRAEASIGREKNVLAAVYFEKCDLDPPFNVDHVEDLSDWNGEDSPSFRQLLSRVAKLCHRAALVSYPGKDAPEAALAAWARQNPSDGLAADILARQDAPSAKVVDLPVAPEAVTRRAGTKTLAAVATVICAAGVAAYFIMGAAKGPQEPTIPASVQASANAPAGNNSNAISFFSDCTLSSPVSMVKKNYGYEFFDRFNNNENRNVYLHEFSIEYINPEYLDGPPPDSSGRQINWTKELIDNKYRIGANKSMETLSSIGNFKVTGNPTNRPFDFGVRFRTTYDYDNNTKDKSGHKSVSGCKYYKVVE